MDSAKEESKEQRIDKVFNVILELASGNLEARGEPTGLNDKIDGAIVRLNMLGEELLTRREERKKTQESLRRNEERWSSFMKSATDSFSLWDSDLNLIELNQVGENLFGSKRENIIGKSMPELSHDVIKSGRYEKYQQVIKTGKPLLIEDCLLHPTKGELYLSVKSFKVGDGLGLVVTNITRRKKMEEALRESGRKFREIFEEVRDVILTLDMTGKIVDINNRIEEIYGWKKEEVMGKRFWETPFFLPENVLPFISIFLDFLKTGRLMNMMELSVRDKWKKIRHVEGRATLLNRDGKPWRLLSMVRDITERKESKKEKQNLEMQLIQAQKMKAIGQLAAGIAHEFNNALTPVVGNAELIEMEIEMGKSFYSSKIGEYCDAILQGAFRAADIAQKLLGFARQGKFNQKDIDINSVVSGATKLLAQGFSSITAFEVKCNLLAKKYINADAAQVHQIINNLALNARDSMSEGGAIVITTEDVTIDNPIVGRFDTIPPGKYVRLSVRDEGKGISEEIMNKIFDPFFTINQKDRGAGLGLAVVWGIVRNHNAFIELKTKKDKGTVFKVYFSAVDRKEEAVRIIKKPVVSAGKGRILIVDDEEYIRMVAERYLNLQGYETMTASNGMEGLEAYDQGNYDLVLADLIMAPINGIQMFHKIKNKNPDAKVLIMSGFQDDEQIGELLKQGALGFIPKPFDLHKLGEIINTALAE
ncbi:MAG: PAS domain S-box protein [Candidatus Eremiobacteraeota bacterium]|nr:PAS domain S-box protein [Candidatus Eremiobacteraeota bacterium]